MSDARAARATAFDARPLVEPVDKAAVREFTRRLRASGAIGSPFSSPAAAIGVIVGVVLFFAVGGIVLSTIASLFAAFASIGSGETPSAWVWSSIIPVVVIGVVVAVVVVVFSRGLLGTRERRYRLDRFATANGMAYLPELAVPGLPGMIFSVGSARAASDLVRGQHPRFVEFANYRYTTGSGKNRQTHRWGYVAIKLDVPLPHIVLDATSNNGLFGGSNLPTTFSRDQRLSLEGDFDRYFSLYCPAGYERDALYLFTPDIMARFIDNAAALDVEIVDDWLFFYGKRDFSTLDPATWAWLFSAVSATLDKLAQWSRWRDDRLRADAAGRAARGSAGDGAGSGDGVVPEGRAVPFAAPPGMLTPPPGVAAPGRRLTRRFSWVSIVVIIGFVLFWLFGQSGVLGSLFFR